MSNPFGEQNPYQSPEIVQAELVPVKHSPRSVFWIAFHIATAVCVAGFFFTLIFGLVTQTSMDLTLFYTVTVLGSFIGVVTVSLRTLKLWRAG